MNNIELSGSIPGQKRVKSCSRNKILVNNESNLRITFILCFLFMLFGSQTSAQDIIVNDSTIQKAYAGGYLITQQKRIDESFGAGYSMYVAAYPLLEDYPGRAFQTGLFGTWMHPHYDDGPLPEPKNKLYTDIEGGLGWWRSTEYATATPKFLIGAVQLSPWILWPFDGLNLKQGTNGELFGSGYLPLPLTEPKSKTAGKDISTGNQCWTLFLNTGNFKGPVAFITPYFWTKASVEDPRLDGLFLDQRPSTANKPIQMETQHVHAYVGKDSLPDFRRDIKK